MQKSIILFKSAFKRYQDVNAHDLGAALAYFTIFSLVPLFSIIILIASFFLAKDRVTDQIVDTLGSGIGTNAANFLKSMITDSSTSAPGIFATIVGFFILLYSVSGVTRQLQGSLDKVLGITERKVGFFKGLWKQLASFSIILFISLVLIIFLTISTGFSFFQKYVNIILPFPTSYVELINFALSLLLVFTIAAIIYRYLPRASFHWRSIFLGAATTSVLFIIGRFLISLYVTYSQPASAYGAAGALIVILLWIYYSAQIFFFGASVMYVSEQSLLKIHQ